MRQNGHKRRGFLYIWGALLIKILISSMVSLVAVIYFWVSIWSESGAQSVIEVLRDQTQYRELLQKIVTRSLENTVYIEGVAAVITILVVMWWFSRDVKQEKLDGIVWEKAKLWKYTGIVILAGTLALGLNNLIILSNISSVSEAYVQTMTLLYKVPFGYQLLVMGILIPINEELVFRGMVYKRLRYDASFSVAMLYSTIIFSLLHANLVQGLYAFILGMVFCFVYEKYGSVKAPILAHITANVLSVVGTEYKWFDWLFAQPARVSVVTVACAAIASSTFVLMQRMKSE